MSKQRLELLFQSFDLRSRLETRQLLIDQETYSIKASSTNSTKYRSRTIQELGRENILHPFGPHSSTYSFYICLCHRISRIQEKLKS